MTKFNQLRAASLRSLPVGKHCDGQGLMLVKRPDGGAQWVYRFTLHRRQREAGLGALHSMTLAQAREQAATLRSQVREGKDPIKLRRQETDLILKGLLEDIAVAAHEAYKGSLKRSEDGRWFSPVRVHLLPRLGRMPITEIDQHDIAAALRPIWGPKHQTARKALARLKVIDDYAYALSQRRRKKIEGPFGWAKTVGGIVQTVHRGLDRVGARLTMTMAA